MRAGSSDEMPEVVGTSSGASEEPKRQKTPTRPDEYLNGEWEVEPYYYSSASSSSSSHRYSDLCGGYLPFAAGTSSGGLGGGSRAASYASLSALDVGDERKAPTRNRRGMVYKSRNDCEYKCFQDHGGVIYRLGDHVFIETHQPTEPYVIGAVISFKMSKRELTVKISRYYRPDDVPEVSYSLIIQERKELGIYDEKTRRLQARELFSSESTPQFSIASLRGKCRVRPVKDIRCALSTTVPPRPTTPLPLISPADTADQVSGNGENSRSGEPRVFEHNSDLAENGTQLNQANSTKTNSETGENSSSPGKIASSSVAESPSEKEEEDDGLQLLRESDAFFTCLNFNQESSRLASVQGEIRVGAGFQAKLPPVPISALSDEPDRDELLYRPANLCPRTETKYVRITRTFRTFNILNNRKVTFIEKKARIADLLLDDALVTLHRCGYNVARAMRVMFDSDQLLAFDSSFLSTDDVKKFNKGIKNFGKNFNKINKDLLPHHKREHLVGFYYLWKKSREAIRPKPLTRQRNTGVNSGNGRRGGGKGANVNDPLFGGVFSNSKNGNATASDMIAVMNGMSAEELLDYASASEAEDDGAHCGSSTQQLSDGIQRACHHCFSSRSRDWHHAGRNRLLMCTDCRLFYKKYGQMREVERPSTVPPCLFKPPTTGDSPRSNGDGDDANAPQHHYGVRTRGAGRKERRGRTTPTLLMDVSSSSVSPLKCDVLSNGVERRTTPQRSAKTNNSFAPAASTTTNIRKRGHRGGSAVSSGANTAESTPTPKSKRARADMQESRTPSPLTNAAGGAVNGGSTAANCKESLAAAALQSASTFDDQSTSSSSSDASPAAATVVKKDDAEEDTGAASMKAEDTMDAQPSTSTGTPLNTACTAITTTITSLSTSGKSLGIAATTTTASQTAIVAPQQQPHRKPMAKVEPLETVVLNNIDSASDVHNAHNGTSHQRRSNSTKKQIQFDHRVKTEQDELDEKTAAMNAAAMKALMSSSSAAAASSTATDQKPSASTTPIVVGSGVRESLVADGKESTTNAWGRASRASSTGVERCTPADSPGAGEDDSQLGVVVDADVVIVKESAGPTVHAFLRRRLKRASGVSCARTDIGACEARFGEEMRRRRTEAAALNLHNEQQQQQFAMMAAALATAASTTIAQQQQQQAQQQQNHGAQQQQQQQHRNAQQQQQQHQQVQQQQQQLAQLMAMAAAGGPQQQQHVQQLVAAAAAAQHQQQQLQQREAAAAALMAAQQQQAQTQQQQINNNHPASRKHSEVVNNNQSAGAGFDMSDPAAMEAAAFSLLGGGAAGMRGGMPAAAAAAAALFASHQAQQQQQQQQAQQQQHDQQQLQAHMAQLANCMQLDPRFAQMLGAVGGGRGGAPQQQAAAAAQMAALMLLDQQQHKELQQQQQQQQRQQQMQQQQQRHLNGSVANGGSGSSATATPNHPHHHQQPQQHSRATPNNNQNKVQNQQRRNNTPQQQHMMEQQQKNAAMSSLFNAISQQSMAVALQQQQQQQQGRQPQQQPSQTNPFAAVGLSEQQTLALLSGPERVLLAEHQRNLMERLQMEQQQQQQNNNSQQQQNAQQQQLQQQQLLMAAAALQNMPMGGGGGGIDQAQALFAMLQQQQQQQQHMAMQQEQQQQAAAAALQQQQQRQQQQQAAAAAALQQQQAAAAAAAAAQQQQQQAAAAAAQQQLLAAMAAGGGGLQQQQFQHLMSNQQQMAELMRRCQQEAAAAQQQHGGRN